MKKNASYILKLASVTLVAAAVVLPLSAAAEGIDGEALFEARCSRCHPKVQDLVNAELFMENGTLCGRACGHDIRLFLPTHRGHPTPEETEALYSLFFQQLKGEDLDAVKSRGGFKSRCAICHTDERELARRYLVRDGDVVRGRYSGRELKPFLTNHGRIDAAELDFFVNLLTPLAPTR